MPKKDNLKSTLTPGPMLPIGESNCSVIALSNDRRTGPLSQYSSSCFEPKSRIQCDRKQLLSLLGSLPTYCVHASAPEIPAPHLLAFHLFPCLTSLAFKQRLLILLLKRIVNARPGEGDWHPISPKTPAPHYQPIEEKKRKGKSWRQKRREQLSQQKGIGPALETHQSHTIE